MTKGELQEREMSPFTGLELGTSDSLEKVAEHLRALGLEARAHWTGNKWTTRVTLSTGAHIDVSDTNVETFRDGVAAGVSLINQCLSGLNTP